MIVDSTSGLFGKKETRPPLRRAGGLTMVATGEGMAVPTPPTRGSSSHQHHLKLYVQYVSGGRNSRRYLPKKREVFFYMESKQIDGVVDDPENGGLKSGPCLIAGFQPLTVVHPSYWNAYKTESGATFSIDMVRLKLSFIYGKGEFGEQNLVHFTVHMDETTPHAHFGFTPIKDGTLSWKNYFDGRDALRGFQNRYWERVGKQWGLERGETGSGRTHKTTQEMKREAQREIKELDKRKECLRQEVEEMEAATPSLSEGVRTLWKARSDGSREEELGSAIEGLRGRISDLSSQIADCNGRAEGIERGLPALRARYRELAERFNDTRSRVEQALGRLREVPNTLSELAQDIARKLGKPLFDPDSLDYLTREVTRVAKALDRDRPHVPQQRGRGAR